MCNLEIKYLLQIQSYFLGRWCNGSILVSKSTGTCSIRVRPEQDSSELRRLSHELGTRTKLEIMDSVVILEHLKVEEPNLESVGLMFIPEPEKETSRN